MESKISAVLQNCQSIKDVVNLINKGGTSHCDANQIAGQYAFTAAKQDGFGYEIENAEAHLSCLSEAGANFDLIKAIDAFVELEEEEGEIMAANQHLADMLGARIEKHRGYGNNLLQMNLTKEDEDLACQVILEKRKTCISKITKSEIGSSHWYVTCLARIKERADSIKSCYVTEETKQQWIEEIYLTAEEMLKNRMGF